MVEDLSRLSRPGSLDSMAMLSPTGKIVGGAVMLAMAIGAFCLPPVGSYGFLLVVLGGGMGSPLLVVGLRERRQAARDAAELARGMAELPALREAVAAAVAQRHNVGRLLRQRGYTSAKVRRRLALECDVVLQAGRDD
ncbi:MAG: hypothetical protein KDC48_03855 [Planctomycetes bacterium]|nr:hypothetical protein [Planctomycetota bacterium]